MTGEKDINQLLQNIIDSIGWVEQALYRLEHRVEALEALVEHSDDNG